jgi:hypothetical protein
VAALRPKRLIPTVNAGSKAQSDALVERFVDLMDLSSHRGRLDSFLLRRPSSGRLGQQQECVQQQQQQQQQEEDAAQQQQREQQVDPEKQHHQQDGWQPSAPAVQGRSGNSTGSNTGGSCSPQSSIVCTHGGGHAHLQQATVELQQTGVTGSTEAVDVSSSCGQAGKQQQQQAVVEQQVDLGDVDIAEQQRLLDEAARVLRLKRSWAAAKAAAKASAKPRKASGRRRCA